MKTRLALVVYFLAIAFITVCAAVIVVKLTFWPVCTGVPSCDGWTVAGLAGTILGVAATFLAILGAVAVAAWWAFLNDRVTDQVKSDVTKLYSKQETEITTKVNALLKENQQKANFILEHFVTGPELQDLKNFDAPGEILVTSSAAINQFLTELRHLNSLGFIERLPGQGFRKLEAAFVQKPEVNVKDYFSITEAGKSYLEQVK